ncbi:MAG TPA: AIR synthase related protein [Candidatus Lokiarchaeia archaeon]|nr:AIR synthase related protein [Candidatus Lokiarchaeia archaeon]
MVEKRYDCVVCGKSHNYNSKIGKAHFQHAKIGESKALAKQKFLEKRAMTYANLGVSSRKEDVHAAIKAIDQGLFPSAFCKIIPDVLSSDEKQCLVFHADGAGTKSILAYLWWKETGDISAFKGIAQDALVMNIDDIACTGIASNFTVSNTIGRNKFIVPGEVIAEVINGYQEFSENMAKLGITLYLCGGETADVGDLVRTIIVDSTVMARERREVIIETNRITPGDVIVGISSTGKASYEVEQNSGISSNGITMARHAVLNHDYMRKYPEIVDPAIDKSLAYAGPYHLDDTVPGTSMLVGKALLSPTRTYVPVVKSLIGAFDSPKEIKDHLHAIIHDTGGGQTKCLNFGTGIRYVKDDLFPIPPIFSLIQQAGSVAWGEMYRVFNMGHRLEVICAEDFVADVIEKARHFKLEAKVIGHVEASDSDGNSVVIMSDAGTFAYP